MGSKKMLAILVLGLVPVVWLAWAAGASPMGTAWTYQGRLLDANGPADGVYDFHFKLFDDPNVVIGNQAGADVNVADVDVIDGYFTVLLDFGGEVFDGNAVWLEIVVRPGDSTDPNTFVTLSPRQKVAPTPYALYAIKAAGFDIPMKFGDGAHTPMLSNTDIQLDHADSDYHVVEIRNDNGASVWGINQDGGTSFGPYTADKDLHLFGGDQVRMTLKGDTGNIGVGLGPVAPTQRLDVAGGNIRVRGIDGFDGAGESAYLYLGDENHYIRSEWGLGLTLGSYLVPEALTIRETNGDVGIGTIEPHARLHVAGAGGADILLDNAGDVVDWSIISDVEGRLLVASGTETFSASRFIIMPNGDTYLTPATGNVGVGHPVYEPAAALHVWSESSEFGMLKLQNSNPGLHEASMAFIPGIDSTPDEYWIQGVGLTEDVNNFAIGRGGPKVVITPEGRVGIGTMDPRDTLTIHDNITSAWPGVTVPGITIGNRGSCSIRMGNDSTKHGDVTWIDPEYLRVLSTHAIYFQTGGYDSKPEVMFDASGNVGIGTADPERRLHVVGDNPRILIEAASMSPEINFKNSNDLASQIWSIYKDGTTSDLRFYQGGNKLTIQNSTGNVGIGTTTPTEKLEVAGTVKAVNNSGTALFGQSTSGTGVSGYTYGGYAVFGRDGSGSGLGYAGYFEGNVWVTATMSAATVVDRTPYPKDVATAYQAVMSMERLPEGEYEELNKQHQLDHSRLDDFIRSKDGNRDLSATVSCLNEVVKDLVLRLE
ncbi:MAG: hypothetical protein OEW48_13560, partial [Phycisphaerae bacterium]|nr:hypothetical protein [Phycisphaerae bacterium]